MQFQLTVGFPLEGGGLQRNDHDFPFAGGIELLRQSLISLFLLKIRVGFQGM